MNPPCGKISPSAKSWDAGLPAGDYRVVDVQEWIDEDDSLPENIKL